MSTKTFRMLWAAIFGFGIGVEVLAIRSRMVQNTLSGTVWDKFDVGKGRWTVKRIILLALLSWLHIHLVTGTLSVNIERKS